MADKQHRRTRLLSATTTNGAHSRGKGYGAESGRHKDLMESISTPGDRLFTCRKIVEVCLADNPAVVILQPDRSAKLRRALSPGGRWKSLYLKLAGLDCNTVTTDNTTKRAQPHQYPAEFSVCISIRAPLP